MTIDPMLLEDFCIIAASIFVGILIYYIKEK